ncbi:MAG TPA: tyrosine-type recombinase/integrase [Streptosporangiaceae bacterium]
MALKGLRVSEATGADIQDLGVERGHRTVVITRKGGKVVTVPLAPRTARAIDLVIGKRCEGPIFLAADGRRLDRHGAARIVRRVTRRAGITKPVGPHTLRHVLSALLSCRAHSSRTADLRACSSPLPFSSLPLRGTPGTAFTSFERSWPARRENATRHLRSLALLSPRAQETQHQPHRTR